MTTHPLQPDLIQQLGQLDSSTIANAIEMFDVRLRNTGFADSSVHCMSPDLPKMVGYAATVRIRTAAPPMEGHVFLDRTDWWTHILSIPAPRIVVVEDLDNPPGLGSFIGEVHANILSSLGCVGIVTNGAVRDLPAMRAIRFAAFAGNLSPSHAFAHILDFDRPVVVGRMKVKSGDLLHGDLNGVQQIPLEIAAQLPDAAKRIEHNKERLVTLCRSSEFTLEKITIAVKEWKP
jgi:regulator of RNase E activity RraA